MKYNYCPKCDRAYVKSRLEKDRCIYCGGVCETVDVKRSGLYYIGYAIALAGSICAVLPNNVAVPEPMLIMAMGVALLVVGIAIVFKGSIKMAKAAKEAANVELPDE